MVVRVIKNIFDTIIFGGIIVGGTIGFLMLVGVITWI